MAATRERVLRVIGLFAGIGGLELGFANQGFRTKMLCEIDSECRAVLERRFPKIEVTSDVTALDELPSSDVVTAGFPCQSFSQAGLTQGLAESRPLIFKLLKLIRDSRSLPQYLVFENVPNIVHLAGGEALRYITRVVESLGYTWAYRIIDASSFGLPQRRARWVFVASLGGDAPTIMLEDNCAQKQHKPYTAHGFYWTEGKRGLGWANDAVPPLKSGSSVGIPSPPAIWDIATRAIVKPSLCDAERLQGFPAGWTALEEGVNDAAAERRRWRMVGNAVSVPMAEWIAGRIRAGLLDSEPRGLAFRKSDTWPRAAWGRSGFRAAVETSAFPRSEAYVPILTFLRDAPQPLSARATRGFRTRLEESCLRYPPAFLAALKRHERAVAE